MLISKVICHVSTCERQSCRDTQECWKATESWGPANLLRRVTKSRKFPDNTCPASRHVELMARSLLKGGYPMLHEEPEHCAESMLATVAALYEARTEIARLQVAQQREGVAR